MSFIQLCCERGAKSHVAKEISGRGRRRGRDEKGNQGVGYFHFINILQLASIYFFSIILLYHFFSIPMTFTHTHTHDPRPTTSTHYPRPTTFSFIHVKLTYGWLFAKLDLDPVTWPRRQGGEHEHAQYPTNDDVTSGWSCRHPENVSIWSSLFSNHQPSKRFFFSFNRQTV